MKPPQSDFLNDSLLRIGAADPTNNPVSIGFDFHFGMKTRGSGNDRLQSDYTSFTSTADRSITGAGLIHRHSPVFPVR